MREEISDGTGSDMNKAEEYRSAEADIHRESSDDFETIKLPEQKENAEKIIGTENAENHVSGKNADTILGVNNTDQRSESAQPERIFGTESLIRNALASATQKKIAINSIYLDDEKLPESERISVLNEIFHRNIRHKQMERLAGHISPILNGNLPPNILIYGPSGTGKSVTCLHFLSTLSKICDEKNVAFNYFYIDLTTPKTCFGALNELAIALDNNTRRYRKGIALEQIQEIIINAMNKLQGAVCFIVDEVDNITVDSDLFYTFLAKTLPKKIDVRVFYIFLTNRLEWEKTIDPRILSVLKKTDMIFEPYDALDLIEI